MTDDVTLLCTADIHLGRHPTRVPDALDGSQFSPTAVWRSIVQEAIDRAVDGVLVAGDVIDRENRFFEAYGPFEAGLARLDEADIPVAVVSGNHDADALPRLLEGVEFDTVQFLGAGGTWERTAIERNGDVFAYVDGWSFPDEHVRNSPLETYDRDAPTDAPLVGLLHADLDAPESEYGPVGSSELVDTPADAWVLGHIHSSGVHRSAEPFVGYPGSPQALDPGERGRHGPWLLTVDRAGTVEATHRPLASVRYDRLEVDVGQAETATDVPAIVSDCITEYVRSAVETGPLELLLVRVVLTGRTPAHGSLVANRESIESQLSLTEGALPIRVERLDVETRPAIDIEALAGGESPAASLAELLLAIDRGTVADDHGQLVTEARSAMQSARASSAYDELRRERAIDRPDETDAIERLERQAMALLDELLTQTEDAP